MRRLLMIVGVAVWSFSSVLGASEGDRADRGLWGLLFWGECNLPFDPAEIELWMATCISLKAGAEKAWALDQPKWHAWIYYGEGYLGFHLNQWLAYHGKGEFYHLHTGGDIDHDDLNVRTEYSFLMVGHPIFHQFRASIGQLALPFGVDDSPAGEFYHSFEDRSYWSSPRHSLILTYDNLHSVMFEIGYGTSEFYADDQRQIVSLKSVIEDVDDLDEVSSDRAGSARLMYDMAALEGSRMVLSGYGDVLGQRRLGLGLVVSEPEGNTSVLEWVRIYSNHRFARYRQLVRLGYQGPWRREKRWVFQYDDRTDYSRMGTLGHDFRLWKHFVIRLAMIYVKDESGTGDRQWYLTSGLEANL